MRYFGIVGIGLLLVGVLAGCAYEKFQSDLLANAYARTESLADAGAAYVGEWTAPFAGEMRSIKIREDGRVKVCLAPSGGTSEGKVYLDNGVPAIIMESGAKVRILATDREFLLLDIYGDQARYYAGPVDEACVSSFRNFR